MKRLAAEFANNGTENNEIDENDMDMEEDEFDNILSTADFVSMARQGTLAP